MCLLLCLVMRASAASPGYESWVYDWAIARAADIGAVTRHSSKHTPAPSLDSAHENQRRGLKNYMHSINASITKDISTG